MANGKNPGFLAALGMDIDPEAVAREQKQRQMEGALGLVNNMNLPQNSQGAAQIGALLAARIGRPEGLTKDQQARVNAAQSAEARMKEWLQENRNAGLRDRELQYKTFVSEEAFKAGLPEIGAQVAGDVDATRKALRAQELELERLGYQTEAAKLAPEQAKENLASTKQNRLQSMGTNKLDDVWEYGATDPNSSMTAWINEDGSAQTADGKILKPGEYTRVPPQTRLFGRGGLGAGGATNTEKGAMRQKGSALYRRGQTMVEMKKILDESVDATGTIAATGNAGKLASWTSRWGNDLYNIMSATGAIGAFTAVGRDGKEYNIDTAQGRRQVATQYADVIDGYLPAEVKKTGELADRWRSLVVELMYIEARAQESGAKQFSDADIQRNAEVIGANVNNPEALRKILLSSYDRAYDTFEYELSMFHPELRRDIMTQDSYDRLVQARDQIHSLYAEMPWVGPDGRAGGGLGTPSNQPSENWTEEQWVQYYAAQQ